jgi:hypothetical protein
VAAGYNPYEFQAIVPHFGDWQGVAGFSFYDTAYVAYADVFHFDCLGCLDYTYIGTTVTEADGDYVCVLVNYPYNPISFVPRKLWELEEFGFPGYYSYAIVVLDFLRMQEFSNEPGNYHWPYWVDVGKSTAAHEMGHALGFDRYNFDHDGHSMQPNPYVDRDDNVMRKKLKNVDLTMTHSAYF